MIVLADLNVEQVTSYHTDDGVKNIDEKVKRIKSRKEYTSLKDSIQKDGILDPVLAMCTSTRPCMVEIGEQRLLIARELDIKTLRAIVYDKDNCGIKVPYIRRLYSVDEFDRKITVKQYYPDKTFKSVKTSIPVIRTIKKYIGAGIARL